ncbi:MAG: accessory gene regulator B family protein [Desulfotomaculaceae bacterium]
MTPSIQSISRRLASATRHPDRADQDAEIFAYAIKVLALNATALAGIIMFSWLLGSLHTTVIIWAAAFSLRLFAGGRHQSGPVICWVLTVGVFTMLGFLVNTFARAAGEYVLLITALGLVLALFTVVSSAPVTIPSKQFAPTKMRQLKMAAVAVVVFWATIALAPLHGIFEQPVLPLGITTGLVIQSLFILPVKFLPPTGHIGSRNT